MPVTGIDGKKVKYVEKIQKKLLPFVVQSLKRSAVASKQLAVSKTVAALQ
jgi:hypothetical protein